MTPPPPSPALSPRRPVPAPERPRHLEVVRGRPTPGRRPPISFVLISVVATCIALFVLVTANVLLGQAGFTQADLEERVVAERLAVESLQLEVARLRAPSRIAAEAEMLGMVAATDVTVVAPARARPTVPDRGPSPKRGRP